MLVNNFCICRVQFEVLDPLSFRIQGGLKRSNYR